MADNDTTATAPEVTELHRSSRNLDVLRAALERWLASTLPDGATPSVTELSGTSATGMSSETLLFDAVWHDDGGTRAERLVARVAPDPVDVPVFPTYDMRKQFDVIKLVGERTRVPVPRVRWCETDESHIGAHFFVMDRVDGDVPPDLMPYTFGNNWLFDATREQQQTLQDSMVDVLAELHSVDTAGLEFLEYPQPGDTHLRRHVADRRHWYEYAIGGGPRSPLLDRGFDWLDEHWPEQVGETVLAWGDSRIGNVLFQDFRPAAVLDWEMVGLGPRELDVAWFVFAHRIFDFFAMGYGMAGMPHYLDRDEVAARYESLTGYALRDLDFFETYAALQYGIVGLVTGRRAVHFGEREMPADVDDLLYNRAQLEQMLA